MENFFRSIPGIGQYFGGEYEHKLLFVPDADHEPDVDHEVSEPALFRFLLNEETTEDIKRAEQAEIPDMLKVLKDIKKESKITEFETHQCSIGSRGNAIKVFHVFIVFKTTCETDGDYWWSLEKNRDYIALQRSRNKNNVKDKCYDQVRSKVKPIVENLEGKGTIQYLLALLWAHQVIPEKYNILNSNCQSFVTFISQQITQEEYEYKGYFKCSPPPENGRNKKMLDLIVILRGRSDWSPLFTVIQMENIDLLDKMIDSGKYDINAFYNEYTPLHYVIMYSKSKMVKHLLKHPLNANPTTRDAYGKSALQLAVTTTMKAEIINLLLAHPKVKIDDVDRDGHTALHLAASVSNVIAVQKLLENGANPTIYDKEGLSPLHVAVGERDGNEIIDLLLAHDKVNVDDVNEFGETALHAAAYASNVIAVKRLIEKGANPNLFDKDDLSPLHVAALQNNGNPMIDLLLEAQKVNGMGDVNYRNGCGWTALHYAAESSNEITAEHLIVKGADVNCRDNNGITPLYLAALSAKDMKIVDLLLMNMKEGDLSRYKNDKILFNLVKENMHGLAVEIGDRFSKKGIKPASTDTDEWTEESDEATGVTDPSINLTIFDGLRIATAKNSQEMDEILKEGNFDFNRCINQDGETPLFFAIRANNVNWVRLLLEKGADPTIRNNIGLTPFHVAVDNAKDFEILNLLLANEKVDINETRDQQGSTALHYAITASNVNVARFLLSKGANPNIDYENGSTILHEAVFLAKDMDVVELLLNHEDVDVHCLDNKGRNALHYARKNKRGLVERIVKRLKEKGALERGSKLLKRNNEYFKKHMRVFSNRRPRKVENFLSDGTIPIEDKIDKISEEYLLSAIKDSDVESVRLLLKNGADIRAWEETGANALNFASFLAKTTDVIDAILETGKFDINGGDREGVTPLHFAIMGTNLETIARHLIQKGADPNIANKRGNTALHFAALYAKTIETITLILENKQVDINHRDELGRTALHYAIEKKNVEMARYLLEKGADPTIRNNEGNNSFHLAAQYLADTDVLNLMLQNEKKIEIDGRNKTGRTALYFAMTASNVTVARFLLARGADPNGVDEKGVTPLHVVVMFAKDMDIVDSLRNAVF
ncbi:putative ankyrin repeat protein RF_0381 [Daphnia pulex]|uniref:putative ankyrin repeat protein RF_0381 n=1 Tax=Daphnia pulex TaxID=6669 RepID=UPI001EDE6A76|nr:putative ankyrin repeat protein RF_0381 [Daphnia pulex]